MSRPATIPESLANFDFLPSSANVRLPTVMGLYGMSAASVWRNSGKSIPAPRKLSPGVTTWNVGELKESLAEKNARG